MRTKALLLAAAFAAAGVATSTAQVYSVNAVGYVNVNLDAGFNMVSNPLDAGATGNTIANLFKNIQGTIPGGLKVFAFNNTTGAFYPAAIWNEFDSIFEPAESGALVISPGNGVFVFNPNVTGSAALVLTFVGEVPQGTLNNSLPKGFSIKASTVPQSAKPDTIGLPGEGGDKFFRFNKGTGAYDTYVYNEFDNVWERNGTVGLPTINVGEAWFMFRANSSATWTRTFNVNNPTS